MKKKALALILLLSIIFSLSSCSGGRYKPVEQTEEEARVVMTMSYGDKEYEVTYDLYRALFLTYKSEIDGGDGSVWGGSDRQSYIDKINAKIKNELCYIYAAFALCDSIGYSLDSKAAKKKVNELLEVSVEGGTYNGATVEGYGGDYDAYLKDIREKYYHTYSSQMLMLRYLVATEAINEHYVGTATADDIDGSDSIGAIEYTREDIYRYYHSDACVRVLRTYVPDYISKEPEVQAEAIRQAVIEAAANGENDVRRVMIDRGTPTATVELMQGYLIGRHSLDESEYREMMDAAFGMSVGEVSGVIKVTGSPETRYYVMYRIEKTDEHFNEAYNDILFVYLYDTLGGILNDAKLSLLDSVTDTDVLINMEYDRIVMD